MEPFALAPKRLTQLLQGGVLGQLQQGVESLRRLGLLRCLAAVLGPGAGTASWAAGLAAEIAGSHSGRPWSGGS